MTLQPHLLASDTKWIGEIPTEVREPSMPVGTGHTIANEAREPIRRTRVRTTCSVMLLFASMVPAISAAQEPRPAAESVTLSQLIQDEDGDLVILATGKEENVLAEKLFNSSIYSTPTIANGVIFISDRSQLYAFKTQ